MPACQPRNICQYLYVMHGDIILAVGGFISCTYHCASHREF
jgi:hypothetical protein